MKIFNLFDIANPKQWKTISSEDFDENGKYNVYGANGIIGKTNTYNHEEETVLITCRGATCGTVNLSEPFSYINGNAMALDNLDKSKAVTKYVCYYFQSYNFQNVITGSAQPQITRESLRKVEIPLPDLETQNKIVAILDKAKAILDKRDATIKKYDELLRATFLDMFGDVVLNPMGWQKLSLNKLSIGKWKSGGTPSRSNQDYFKGEIPWVTSGELNELYISETKEKITLDAVENSNAKFISENSLLIGMYDTAALKSSINTIPLACNQAIAYAQIDKEKSNILYVHTAIQIGKEYFKSAQRGARQQNLNLTMVGEIEIPNPSIDLQNSFGKVCLKIHKALSKLNKSSQKIQDLISTLSQQAFKGELDFNTAVDLEVLLENDYDFFKENSNSSSIKLLLERLNTDELNENRFNEQQTYDKAKNFVFELIKEGKVKQVFDKKNKKVRLTV